MSSCPYQKSNWVLGSLACGLAVIQAYLLYIEHQKTLKLQKDLHHEVEKRAADRTGRIRSQQKLREAVKSDLQEQGGQQMKYIGYIQSPFPDRRGTPRQV